MKKLAHSLRMVGLLVLTSTIFGATARAQQITAEGSFVLPYRVHWQAATLPAGRYTFSIEESAGGQLTLVFIRGPRGKRGKLITAPRTKSDFKGKSSLMVVAVNGKPYVQSLRLGPLATEFEYPVPKAKPENHKQKAQIIPVCIAAR